MSSEWKPGDVAWLPNHGCRAVVADDGSFVYGPHLFALARSATAELARPLVVIDPEDREQVERLTTAIWVDYAAHVKPSDVTMTQAALRSLIEPPLPMEPADWSVAIVANNTPFMRVAENHITPPFDECWFGESPRTGERVRVSWAGLHALGDVRVVNEAVTS